MSKSPPGPIVGNECISLEEETDSPAPGQDDVDETDLNNDARIAHSNLESKSPNVLLDQERYLPIANVVRIMKTQMDPQAKLAKDAKECVQECVSEFISFIASEAAAFCHNTKRKTITADDLLTALEATGFDNYAEPMRIFLMKYRQAHKITGPIHRPHINYNRPKQFMNDPPVKPLFFDTEQGRRCTETQYVVNGSEVVKNAPLADEWNEKTGTLNSIVRSGVEKVYFESVESTDDGPNSKIRCIDHKELQSSSAKETGPNLPEGAIELEQQQQMQIYIDPTSKQHYAAMETPNGMELYPIMIQDTPLQLESVADPNHILVHLSDGTTGTVSTTPIAPDSSSAKKWSGRDYDFRLKRMVKKKPNTRISHLEEETSVVTTQQRSSLISVKRPLSKREQ